MLEAASRAILTWRIKRFALDQGLVGPSRSATPDFPRDRRQRRMISELRRLPQPLFVDEDR